MTFITLRRHSSNPAYDGKDVVVNSDRILCMFPAPTGTMIQFRLDPDEYISVKETPSEILACIPGAA